MWKSAAGIEHIHGYAIGMEGIDNLACAKSSGFKQRTVDFLRLGQQRAAEQKSGQIRIHEYRTVAVPPVQREQPRLARFIGCCLCFEPGMDVHAFFGCGFLHIGRNCFLHIPLKNIPNRRLSGFIAIIARDNSVFHDTAHAFDFPFCLTQQHMADRGSHRHNQLARCNHAHRRNGGMRVHVPHSNCCSGLQTDHLCHFFCQLTGLGTEGNDIPAQLGFGQILESGIQRFEKGFVRISVRFVPNRLVACSTAVADNIAGHLRNHPVGGFQELVSRIIDFRRLVQDLPDLGHHPFGGDFAAVAGQPFLTAFSSDAVDLIRFILCRVMLPQLRPAVRVLLILRQQAQRLSLFINGQHRTRGKINSHTHNIRRIDSRLADNLRYGTLQYFNIVCRMLKRPVVLQLFTGSGQNLINNMMRVRRYMIRDFRSVRQIHKHRTSGLGSVVDADRIFFTHVYDSPLYSSSQL
ncbi:hypothetical protein D3C75_587400 [compost metagenome]